MPSTSATQFDEFERELWAGRAEAFARTHANLCRHTIPLLLDAAGVDSGSRVLDAGCGPGNLTVAATARGAQVVAVDAEPGMVELTARTAEAAETRVAVLPHLPFEDGVFDAALSNFVINHVGRPVEAVAELRRVTRPGRLVAVTVWAQPPAPGQLLLRRSLAAGGATLPQALPEVAPQDDFPRTADGLRDLLDRGGLAEVHSQYVSWDHRAAPQEWWSAVASGVASSGHTFVRQTPQVAAEVKRQFDVISAEFLDADGMLSLPHTAILGYGRA